MSPDRLMELDRVLLGTPFKFGLRTWLQSTTLFVGLELVAGVVWEKILLASWWLEADAGVVWEKNTIRLEAAGAAVQSVQKSTSDLFFLWTGSERKQTANGARMWTHRKQGFHSGGLACLFGEIETRFRWAARPRAVLGLIRPKGFCCFISTPMRARFFLFYIF